MKTVLSYLLVVTLGVTAAHAQASESSNTAVKHDGTPSTSLHVIGAVETPRDFNLTAIKALVAHDTEPADVVCASRTTATRTNNFCGVRLTDVINHVGIQVKGHKDKRRIVIIARATDSYVVTFSLNELFNTPIGKNVLVAWEKDGKPLGAHDGQFLLISGQDIKTGPRHVRWLSQIEIKRER